MAKYIGQRKKLYNHSIVLPVFISTYSDFNDCQLNISLNTLSNDLTLFDASTGSEYRLKPLFFRRLKSQR